MRIQVLVPGEQPRMADVRDGSRDNLFDLQQIVGGYLEVIRTKPLHDKRNIMLVDEDGNMKGLPFNYGAMTLSGYAGPIMGTVVICGERLTSEGMEWSDYNE